MKEKIRLANVRSRPPYFIQCSWCNAVVEGYNEDEVVEKAQNQGYEYDYERDLVFCNHCAKENKELQKRRKKYQRGFT